MERRISTWMEDLNGDIAVLVYGSASLLEQIAVHAHRRVPCQTAKGVMFWLHGDSIDLGFHVLREAVHRGEIRVHPPIGEPTVVEIQPLGVDRLPMEEKCS